MTVAKRQHAMRERVWYIEARACDAPDAFASEDAASMGSAVLVEVEHRDEPRRVRRYLLTCAHVVRRNGGVGAAWEEILCWRPGRGYTRTHAGKRRCGEHPDIFRARIGPLSPCGGVQGARPVAALEPPDDWVLLDVEDAAFQKEGRPLRWSGIDEDDEVYIVGYPGGAGLTKHPAGTTIWSTGSLVENHVSGPFRQRRAPEAGMLSLSGVDETRPGMSGGGIFDEEGALVGLHRAADDMAMQRNAISALHIRDILDTQRHARPTEPEREPVVPRRWLPAIAAMLALAVIAAAGWRVLGPRDCALDVAVSAPGRTPRVLDALRADGTTHSQLLRPDGSAYIVLKRLGSGEPWSVGIRFDGTASGPVALVGCPAKTTDFEPMENVHVVLAPR